jgi:hypothetical protein
MYFASQLFKGSTLGEGEDSNKKLLRAKLHEL